MCTYQRDYAIDQSLNRYSRFFFFFQAEDGIRDLTVTGVQTCALPISTRFAMAPPGPVPSDAPATALHGRATGLPGPCTAAARSEERRVGKSVDLGGRRIIKKKKKVTVVIEYVRRKGAESQCMRYNREI